MLMKQSDTDKNHLLLIISFFNAIINLYHLVFIDFLIKSNSQCSYLYVSKELIIPYNVSYNFVTTPIYQYSLKLNFRADSKNFIP